MRQKRTNLLSQTPTTQADLDWGRKLLLREIGYEDLWREASVWSAIIWPSLWLFRIRSTLASCPLFRNPGGRNNVTKNIQRIRSCTSQEYVGESKSVYLKKGHCKSYFSWKTFLRTIVPMYASLRNSPIVPGFWVDMLCPRAVEDGVFWTLEKMRIPRQWFLWQRLWRANAPMQETDAYENRIQL